MRPPILAANTSSTGLAIGATMTLLSVAFIIAVTVIVVTAPAPAPAPTPAPIPTPAPTLAPTPAPTVEITHLAIEQLDGFGRVRVSNIETVFDSKQIYDNVPLMFDQEISGTGSSTYSNVHARSRLSVGPGAGSVVRQTFRRFNYQPGKSQLVYMTGVLRVAGTFSDDVTSRLGYFSSSNGIFFSFTGGLVYLNIRKAGNDTTIVQSEWNLDTMNGTGLSGITLDPTVAQIFVFNFQWLGVGSIWFGVIIDGQLWWCHREDNANRLATVYMSTPNLPLRIEISGAAGSGSIDIICASVNVEGGIDAARFERSFGNVEAINANTVGVEYVAMMIRYKNESAAQITLTDLIVSTVGITADKYMVLIRLIRNTTKITNFGIQTWTSLQESAMEAAVPTGNPANAVVTADALSSASGYIFMTSYALGNSNSPTISLTNSLSPGWSIAGQSDILAVTIIPFGASLNVYASLTWREI